MRSDALFVRVHPELNDLLAWIGFGFGSSLVSLLPVLAFTQEGLGTSLVCTLSMAGFMWAITLLGLWQLVSIHEAVLDQDGLRVRSGLRWSAKWRVLPLEGLSLTPHEHLAGRGGTQVSIELSPRGESSHHLQLPGGRTLPQRGRAIAERDWLLRVLESAARHHDEPTRVLAAYAPREDKAPISP